MSGRIGPGAFVAVVGASGVGKDALLAFAHERGDDDVVFPRRTITRPSGAGEDHDPLSPDGFEAARARGAFAVHWDAHGLRYGIPASVDEAVRAGRVVVANVSRGAVDELDARYERLLVVRVTVPEAVREARLLARDRESAEEIAARLQRPEPEQGRQVDVVIVNDRSREEAGAELLEVIRAAEAATARRG